MTKPQQPLSPLVTNRDYRFLSGIGTDEPILTLPAGLPLTTVLQTSRSLMWAIGAQVELIADQKCTELQAVNLANGTHYLAQMAEAMIEACEGSLMASEVQS